MTVQHLQQFQPRRSVARLEAEIAQRQATIEQLKSAGHLTADAEKHLRFLKESVDLLR